MIKKEISKNMVNLLLLQKVADSKKTIIPRVPDGVTWGVGVSAGAAASSVITH